MDYLVAYMAWDLDILDILKIAENSYKYASISEETKAKYIPFFHNRWERFCKFVVSRY
jgi:hypothetical protein